MLDTSTTNALRLSAAALLSTLLLVACAGAPGATQQPSPAGPGTSPPTGPGTTAPGMTDQPPGAGVDINDPCGLATVEEVSTALGTDVVEAEAQPGGSTTYCNYRAADGALLLATSFSRGQTFVFDSFAGSDDAIPVPGVGEAAVISSGTLFIKQGDAVVGIQPSTQIGSAEELVEALSTLARAIADRL